MHHWIRHFLPFGLVRAMQIASEFERIGLARGCSWKRNAWGRLQYLNLNLLPTGALAGPPACIVDVGANAGNWTGALLDFYQPAQVICVEPDPRLAGQLRTRFAGNAAVSIIEKAVGSVPGMAELNVMEDGVYNSLRQPSAEVQQLYPASFRMKETVQVDVQPLDVLLKAVPRVKLLKIDVQGFEREALAGAKEVLRRTEFVLMEANFRTHYEGEAEFFELQNMMRENGFFMSNYSAPQGSRQQALWADVLYVRAAP